MEEAPHAPRRRVWALVQLHPPNPPPRPVSGSHRLPNTLGQVGEQYGPSIAPFGRARCPFLPLLRPYSSGGAARGSHTGQFSCFGPRSCFIAFVLDIPNGFCPLNRAVGIAHIRQAVPSPVAVYPRPHAAPCAPCGPMGARTGHARGPMRHRSGARVFKRTPYI
jgi:hypothetical protein